jgi:predicted transcriptional regulator
MTRTTVRLPEDLMREVKKVAAETDRTLTSVIEDALREHLGRRHAVAAASNVELPEDGEGGLLPDVVLDDSRALRKLLDEGRDIDARR